MQVFLLLFSLKNLLLVHIPKVQAALEHGDLGHKISHELRCAGPASPQTTEGLNDEWFTVVLTIAYSLSSEELNLALAKKKSNCISTSSFNIFKFFFNFCWTLDVLRIGLKTELKKSMQICLHIMSKCWSTLMAFFVYSHVENILKKAFEMKSSEVSLRYFIFSH